MLSFKLKGFVNVWWTGEWDSNHFIHIFGLVGSMIKPHTLFLHSALVTSRNIESNRRPNVIKKAYRYFKIDSAIAFTVAMIINTSIIAIAATGKNACHEILKQN